MGCDLTGIGDFEVGGRSSVVVTRVMLSEDAWLVLRGGKYG